MLILNVAKVVEICKKLISHVDEGVREIRDLIIF